MQPGEGRSSKQASLSLNAESPTHDPFQRHQAGLPCPLLTHTVALGVLQEPLHAALTSLAVEGTLGVQAREACLAVVCAQLTLVHIWRTEAGSQGPAGWRALAHKSPS